MSALAVIFFFGGWMPILVLDFIPGWIWFGLKLIIFMYIFVIIRATLPRYRFDQLMLIGWKIFLPISLVLVFIYLGLLLVINNLIL